MFEMHSKFIGERKPKTTIQSEFYFNLLEQGHSKTYKIMCATSKDSDLPAHICTV